jgi:PAS domain S-box-containing protein
MTGLLPLFLPPADDPPASAAGDVPILIVDDNAAKRLALKAVLLSLGYRIVEADSGVAALRCVMAQDFAVILLDVCMPDMDGFETAALIRQRRQSEMTPIIFITAFGSDEIVSTDRYAEGAVDFIFAPVPGDELRAKVAVFANLFLKAEGLATRARAVQTSADQLRLLTDAAPIGIFQTDADNRYVYTNPRWCDITGISSEEAAGQTWDTIITAETRAGLIAEMANATTYRSEVCHRFEIQRTDGDTRVALMTSKAIPDAEGATTGWVGTLADVTAETEVEAALSEARDEATEASRLKSDFLANMSHEIRTPMNGVIGMTDLLLETDLDPRQRDYALTVRNSGEALLTIINDILDFSKVEAGKLEIEDVAFNVATVVDDVVDLLAGPAQSKSLELIAVVDSSVPGTVHGDPGRVRQVLTNLIGNALKFTQTGEIVVRVSAEGTHDGGPTATIRFDVSDTGDGIAPDKLGSIFQPFVQADTSTSRRYGGTGLGLAIASQLVALMGGDCGLSSDVGVGSTFWFTINVGVDVRSPAHPPFSPDAGLAGVSALIVSDSATQSNVLLGFMTVWGMTVRTADSGRSALATLQTAASEGRPIAVVLLDWSMSGMDGPKLKNAILIDAALTARLVLMTDLGHERDFAHAPRSGAGASVPKPVHREELRVALRVALGLEVAEVRPPPAAPSPSGTEPDKGRLLLAEDNLINQKVAMAMLLNAGYRVDAVLNGAAAVQAVASRPYDAVLMDCQMPELNGFEATAAIRALKSSGRLTPIIAMTAGARPEDRERCLAEGMDSYMAKPVSKETLLALVARSVGQGTATGPMTPGAGRRSADDLTIDPAVFDELRLLGEATEQDFLAELVGQFVADTGPLLVQLRQAMERGDAAAVARIAHTIKGSGDQLGGRRLALSCSRLEKLAKADSLLDAKTRLQEVEFDYQDLCRMLTRQLSSPDRQEAGSRRA